MPLAHSLALRSWSLLAKLPTLCVLLCGDVKCSKKPFCRYKYLLLVLRIDRWFLLEFSTKKHVLFTTYFMASFRL